MGEQGGYIINIHPKLDGLRLDQSRLQSNLCDGAEIERVNGLWSLDSGLWTGILLIFKTFILPSARFFC